MIIAFNFFFFLRFYFYLFIFFSFLFFWFLLVAVMVHVQCGRKALPEYNNSYKKLQGCLKLMHTNGVDMVDLNGERERERETSWLGSWSYALMFKIIKLLKGILEGFI